jgi:hypothetical protein
MGALWQLKWQRLEKQLRFAFMQQVALAAAWSLADVRGNVTRK